MLNRIQKTALLFTLLWVPPSFAVSPNACEILFGPTNTLTKAALDPRVSTGLAQLVQEGIEARIESVTSTESLARLLLASVNSTKPDDVADTHQLAKLLFNHLELAMVQQIARSLLVNHGHLASASVRWASIYVDRIIASGQPPAEVLDYFLRPQNLRVFAEWIELGETFRENKPFLFYFLTALKDYKQFNAKSVPLFDVARAQLDYLKSLENLDDPSLIGRYVDVFTRADRLTRQYLIEQTMGLRASPDRTTTGALKGSQDDETGPASAVALLRVLSRPLTEIQETAYFHYPSVGGKSRRPQIYDMQAAKAVALGFIVRTKYDLAHRDVNFAAGVLADLPIESREIDWALARLLKAAKETPYRSNDTDSIYARHELRILRRHALHLSSVRPTFQFNARLLKVFIVFDDYRQDILELHEEFDLRHYPDLAELLRAHLTHFPDAFRTSSAGEVEKLKKDLGVPLLN